MNCPQTPPSVYHQHFLRIESDGFKNHKAYRPTDASLKCGIHRKPNPQQTVTETGEVSLYISHM